jgi:hypothetical protein
VQAKGKPGIEKGRGFTIAVLAMAAACTSAAAFTAYMLLFQLPVYDVIEFPMEVYVDRIVGINAETDVVHFGIVPPGGSSGRKMTVAGGDFRTLVTFESSGDISPWVTVSENNIVLERGANATVMIDVYVPKDVVPLAYRNGTLRITFRKALF